MVGKQSTQIGCFTFLHHVAKQCYSDPCVHSVLYCMSAGGGLRTEHGGVGDFIRETCIEKALEVLLHCVASLSSSVLCKEREVNPTRLTNPCQGPALSRTQGTASQGLTPSTAMAACQACSGCR